MQRMLDTVIRIAAMAVVLAGVGTSPLRAAEATLDQQVVAAHRETTILAAYRTSPVLGAYDLSVVVVGDRAALSGFVDRAATRAQAEQVALASKGIASVDNRIIIDAGAAPRIRAGSSRDASAADAKITASIESKLQWNALTDGLDARVVTRDGQVTLSGSAISYAERDMAGIVATDTDGVAGVHNELSLADGARPASRGRSAGRPARDPPSDAWITSSVKSSLLFTRGISHYAITVTTHGGVVSLAGIVASKSERDLAMQVAQDVRGVTQVDGDALTVG